MKSTAPCIPEEHKPIASSLRKDLVASAKRIVVKIGSRVLTSKGEGLDFEVINALVAEISNLAHAGREILVVSSGAIAAGVKELRLRALPRTIAQKQAIAAVGQSRLIWAYERAFRQHRQRVAQVLLTHEDLRHRARYLNARNTLLTLLRLLAIPIINENDTVSVAEIKFGDNDTLSAMVADLVQADLLVILTDLDGLYTADPRVDPQAQFIPEVARITPDIEAMGGRPYDAIGRGGMLTKLQAAKSLAASGIPTIIANGLRPGILAALLAGESVGTFFHPERRGLRGRKRWIATTLRPRGTLIVDAGAKLAIVARGKSLLPSGLVAVEGEFDFGDLVRCCDTDGREFARGLVNYSGRELRLIKGLHTSKIEERLGHKDYDEVIHRDNLVIWNGSGAG
jgi:glutamate 5-kinase